MKLTDKQIKKATSLAFPNDNAFEEKEGYADALNDFKPWIDHLSVCTIWRSSICDCGLLDKLEGKPEVKHKTPMEKKDTPVLPEIAKRRQLNHLTSHHPTIERYHYNGKDVSLQELERGASDELGAFIDMMNLPSKEAMRVFNILSTFPFAISRVLRITYESESESLLDTTERSIFSKKRPNDC